MNNVSASIYSSPAWTTKRQYKWGLQEFLGTVTGYGRGVLSLDNQKLVFILDDGTPYFDLLLREIKIVEFITGNTLKIKTSTGRSYRLALYDVNDASSYQTSMGVQIQIMAGANDVTDKWITVLRPVVTVSIKDRTNVWKFFIRSMMAGVVFFAGICMVLLYYFTARP